MPAKRSQPRELDYESKISDDRVLPFPGMTCPKCGAGMVRGLLLDQSGSYLQQPVWVPLKRVVRGWFGLRAASEKTTLRVETHRCQGCGFLESFAGKLIDHPPK
jgi:hypothetical protein